MISIGLPAFKGAYLEKALESVLSQSYVDFELIIINDLSPDDLDPIIEKFKDSRVRYIKNEKNLGPIGNWNKCLSLAKGEYFVLFSDDDIFDSNILNKLLDKFKKYPETSLVHCKVEIIDGENSTISIAPSCPEFETAEAFIFERINRRRNFYAPGFMVRTQELRSIGGFVDFPLAWFSDDATWYQMANLGGVCYVDEVLCKWRYSGSNISNIGNAESRMEAGEKYLSWFIEFSKMLNLSDEKRSEYCRLANLWVDQNKRNCIIRSSGKGVKGLIRGIRTWRNVRGKYDLSFVDLLKIIYHVAF